MNSDKVYIAYTIIFIIIFSKFYKIYDFLKKIISKMNIKNEILIMTYLLLWLWDGCGVWLLIIKNIKLTWLTLKKINDII